MTDNQQDTEEWFAEYDRLLEQLGPYFWKHPGNLIEHLNRLRSTAAQEKKQKWVVDNNIYLNLRSPSHIYFIHFPLFNVVNPRSDKTFYLFKVGMTDRNVITERPDEVMAKINKSFPHLTEAHKPKLIWNVLLGPNQTQHVLDIELMARGVGIALEKSAAKDLGLPISTEWCTIIHNKYLELQNEIKENSTTTVFKGKKEKDGKLFDHYLEHLKVIKAKNDLEKATAAVAQAKSDLDNAKSDVSITKAKSGHDKATAAVTKANDDLGKANAAISNANSNLKAASKDKGKVVITKPMKSLDFDDAKKSTLSKPKSGQDKATAVSNANSVLDTPISKPKAAAKDKGKVVITKPKNGVDDTA
eukprot:gene16933-20141_t